MGEEGGLCFGTVKVNLSENMTCEPRTEHYDKASNAINRRKAL